jgi:hypothetical protein
MGVPGSSGADGVLAVCRCCVGYKPVDSNVHFSPHGKDFSFQKTEWIRPMGFLCLWTGVLKIHGDLNDGWRSWSQLCTVIALLGSSLLL